MGQLLFSIKQTRLLKISFPKQIKMDSPVYSAIYSGIPVYEAMIQGIPVMRRMGDAYMNATQILKLAGIVKSQRTICQSCRAPP